VKRVEYRLCRLPTNSTSTTFNFELIEVLTNKPILGWRQKSAWHVILVLEVSPANVINLSDYVWSGSYWGRSIVN
jgi:hypothetical protein